MLVGPRFFEALKRIKVLMAIITMKTGWRKIWMWYWWEMKSVSPTILLCMQSCWFSSKLRIPRLVCKTGGSVGQHPTITQPSSWLPTPSHAFPQFILLQTWTLWRHLDFAIPHPSCTIFYYMSREKGFEVLSPTRRFYTVFVVCLFWTSS